MREVKKLAENPELGAYRVSAALEQMGIKLSRSTCGRLLSVNRDLYHLQLPRKGGRPKATMPFKAERRHQFWSFEKAHTWEDLLAAHEKRDDGCHSPAAVLQWIKGMQPEPDLMYRAFSAICETRTLTKAGYAKFRNFLLYGEQGLAGNKTLVNIFQDTLTLEYGEYPLSRYSVEWQPNDHHLLRVGNPRLYDHPFQSLQLPLWELGEVEWYVIIRTDPSVRRRRHRGRIVLIQPPLLADGTQG